MRYEILSLQNNNINNNNIHMKKKTTTTISLDDVLQMFNEEDIIKADGFDDCIVGVESRSNTILVYSTKLILEKLISNSQMTWEEAIEYFDYNMQGAKERATLSTSWITYGLIYRQYANRNKSSRRNY